MNKLMSGHQSSTLSSIVVISGMFVCQHIPIETNKIYLKDAAKKEMFVVDNSNSTYSQYGGGRVNDIPQIKLMDGNFEKKMGQFYAKLLADQEPLGEEFEAVLFNNLWNLYES